MTQFLHKRTINLRFLDQQLVCFNLTGIFDFHWALNALYSWDQTSNSKDISLDTVDIFEIKTWQDFWDCDKCIRSGWDQKVFFERWTVIFNLTWTINAWDILEIKKNFLNLPDFFWVSWLDIKIIFKDWHKSSEFLVTQLRKRLWN